MKNNDLIERYLYAVIKHLPDKNRDDIKQEIKTLIEDLIDSYSELDEEKKIEKALLELGDPRELAESYRDQKKYLIGPANYNHYVLTLKIVFIALFVGISIASVVDIMFSDTDITTVIASYISNIIGALAQGFAWVTFMFAIIEYNHINVKENEQKDWRIEDLPKIPKQNLKISRASSIVGLFFITIFTLVFYYIPEEIAIYINQDDKFIKIPIFAIDVIKSYRILILGLFIIGVAKEVIKIIAGYWSWVISITYSLLTVLSTFFILIFILNNSIWNPNLSQQIEHYFKVEMNFSSYILEGFIAILIIGTIIEVVSVLIKGFKSQKS